MGGMEPNEATRLHHLEDENSRLKRLVADLSLDREMLKALLTKKRTELVDRRANAAFLMEQFAASQCKACELANIARSSFRYRANSEKDDTLREKLTQLAHEKPRLRLSPSRRSPAQRGADRELQETVSCVPCGRSERQAQKEKTFDARGSQPSRLEPARPTMGNRLRTRSNGQRQKDTGAECRGYFHTRMLGLGSGYLSTQPARQQSTRPCDRHGAASRSGSEWTTAANLPLVISWPGALINA
jgi:hypothetical protein